ncbi:MAG: phage tail assembly chaperone [Peptococcaceae bacterium]
MDEFAKDELLLREDDLIRGLLTAANEKNTEETIIEIARKGKVLFKFAVHPLSEKEYNDCRDQATKYVISPKTGIRIPKETDATKFRSLLIYYAAREEDREKLWNNKRVWEQLDVLSGPDLIDRVLFAGEKDAVVDKIDEISGFKDLEDEKEKLAKN